MLRFESNLFRLQRLSEIPFLCNASVSKLQACGIKFYYPREPVDTSEWPEYRKLRQVEKQPTYTSIKSPKMYKMLHRIRGPETVHNELIYKCYGVKALLGGRMQYKHFEAIRTPLNRKLDTDRMFALWRIDAPWQPLTKRPTGKRLGGGRGPIHHYCTPVKADRIILELAGDVYHVEAIKILSAVVELLPFPSRVVSQQDLDNEKAREKWIEENNANSYTMEYVIKNNMGGCHNMLSKYDYIWLGKYK